MDSPAAEPQKYVLTRTDTAPSPAADGLIPGVDAPGKVENGVFTPDTPDLPAPSYWRDAPWWMILTPADLGRVVAGIEEKRQYAAKMKAEWAAEEKHQEGRISRTINWYGPDILPECPPDRKYRRFTCPITRGTYVIMNERAGKWRLVERNLAREANLLRMVEDAETSSVLTAHYMAHGIPAGYEYLEAPGITYTPPASVYPEAPAADELAAPIQ